MLNLLFTDDDAPRTTSPEDAPHYRHMLSVWRLLGFLALLIPFLVFAFAMTALFGASRQDSR